MTWANRPTSRPWPRTCPRKCKDALKQPAGKREQGPAAQLEKHFAGKDAAYLDKVKALNKLVNARDDINRRIVPRHGDGGHGDAARHVRPGQGPVQQAQGEGVRGRAGDAAAAARRCAAATA